jgi:hypothetical protein
MRFLCSCRHILGQLFLEACAAFLCPPIHFKAAVATDINVINLKDYYHCKLLRRRRQQQTVIYTFSFSELKSPFFWPTSARLLVQTVQTDSFKGIGRSVINLPALLWALRITDHTFCPDHSSDAYRQPGRRLKAIKFIPEMSSCFLKLFLLEITIYVEGNRFEELLPLRRRRLLSLEFQPFNDRTFRKKMTQIISF